MEHEKTAQAAQRAPGRRRLRLWLLLALLSAVYLWILWGNSALTTSTVHVADARIPKAFSGYRIAQVSDLHDAQFGEGNETLLHTLAALDADIIVITGDLVDANRTDIGRALRFAEGAVRLAPVYYVTGNHEGAVTEYRQLRDGLARAGVTVLDNRAVTLTRGGAALSLIGLDDANFATAEEVADGVGAMLRGKLRALIENPEAYHIVLAHRPEYFSDYAEGGASLVMSGHAHGGQFRLPLIGGLAAPGQGFFPQYDAGLYRLGRASMVVSRGLGNSVIPFRINNRPEVVLVILESAQQYAG